ncbi:MAG: type IV toxin-antitoxin system AbiEi family antitoxin domain-containing protein [Capsulimonas sp.]|uniref:type IV toxin-antitoxin system AbiEi family antitoxin domain-containing protein n=1 Tax=Capsulimonas sp. TaxID=2494211 RepID=UPI003265EBE7
MNQIRPFHQSDDTLSMPTLPSGVLRARSLVGAGLSRQRIKELTDTGKLLRLGRGLYSLPDSPITENHDLAQIAARVSQGVICLSSALQFHGLTTASPWRVHLLLPRGARPPQIEHPPVTLTFASGNAYQAGIEEHMIEGVSVKVTSISKTIADCFKYRSKIGLDVALEALKQVLQEQRATRAEIRKYAQICRVENVMRPYLEALSL